MKGSVPGLSSERLQGKRTNDRKGFHILGHYSGILASTPENGPRRRGRAEIGWTRGEGATVCGCTFQFPFILRHSCTWLSQRPISGFGRKRTSFRSAVFSNRLIQLYESAVFPPEQKRVFPSQSISPQYDRYDKEHPFTGWNPGSVKLPVDVSGRLVR